MSDITYSFIIPHKNTPLLLKRCLDSIPQRDDVEVIVVDNNSSERMVDFSNHPGCYRPDVRIIRDNVSIGAGGARNTGLNEANGKWVLFADADDYYSEGLLEHLDRFCNSTSEVIYFNFQVLKDNLVIDYPCSLKYFNSFDSNAHDFTEAMRYRFSAPWNKMVNRGFLLSNNIQFEDCITGNDIFFSYQIGYKAKEIKLDSFKLYNYNINAYSNTHNRKNDEAFYVCQMKHFFQMNDFLKRIGHPEWVISILRAFIIILMRKNTYQFLMSLKAFLLNYKDIVDDRCYFSEHILTLER